MTDINLIKRILHDIAYDAKMAAQAAHDNKRDAERMDDMGDALWSIDQAKDAIFGIEDRLLTLIDEIERGELSAKIHAKKGE